MKKILLTILLCGVMVLGVTGCGKTKETDSLNDTYNKIEKYFKNEKVDYSNLAAFALDEKNNVVVVALKDNSKEKQEEFIKQTDVNSKYIKFDSSISATVSEIDFYITKPESHNDIRFNDYFTFSDRKIYLAGNIEQFYVVDGRTMILKEYISNANRTMDDSIKSITDKLELRETLKDGGTKIYKSKDKDITIIVCNTTKNDKNVFIGDYSMEYVDGDCKN